MYTACAWVDSNHLENEAAGCQPVTSDRSGLSTMRHLDGVTKHYHQI